MNRTVQSKPANIKTTFSALTVNIRINVAMNRSQFEQYSQNIGTVLSIRLAMLPWWWMSDPVRAEKETRKMFSEKEAAFAELQRQTIVAPTQFWYELWCGFFRGDADGGLGRAIRSTERKLTHPYTSRVSAKRKRLSKG